jgi:hypothetical protein
VIEEASHPQYANPPSFLLILTAIAAPAMASALMDYSVMPAASVVRMAQAPVYRRATWSEAGRILSAADFV